MSVPADLWTLSRTGDPWILLDRLIIDGQIEILRSWFENPDSLPLHFGGYHFLDGLPVWDEPDESDVVRPTEGDFALHVEHLLRAPMSRLAAELRDAFRGFASVDEAHGLAIRILSQLRELRSSATSRKTEQGHAETLMALDELETLVDERLSHWSSGIRDLRLPERTDPNRAWSEYRKTDGRYKYKREQKEWAVAEWERIKEAANETDKSLFVGTFAPAFQKRFRGSSTPDESTLRKWVRKSKGHSS